MIRIMLNNRCLAQKQYHFPTLKNVVRNLYMQKKIFILALNFGDRFIMKTEEC